MSTALLLLLVALAIGCMTPAPGGQTPGSALIHSHIFWACGVNVSHISWGMTTLKPSCVRHGAAYSTFGNALTSLERLGVAPCQARLSRKTPAPAGAPTSVECRIQSGSSSVTGGGCCACMRPRNLTDGTVLPREVCHQEVDGHRWRRHLHNQFDCRDVEGFPNYRCRTQRQPVVPAQYALPRGAVHLCHRSVGVDIRLRPADRDRRRSPKHDNQKNRRFL